jgi:transposase-like protein
MVTETLYQELIDAEATAHIGAARFERSEDRTTQRNGTRPRVLTTTAGDLNLKVPRPAPRVVLPRSPRAAQAR